MKTQTQILAWDYSRSTRLIKHYHKHGKNYVDEFRRRASAETILKYLLWDDSCVEITASKLDRIIETQEGNGDTYPSTIVQWILDHINLNDTSLELWIITDGEIQSSELNKCSMLNRSVTYELVKFIIIKTGNIDMSVGAGFMNVTVIEIFINDRLYKRIDTANLFDYTSITIDNFQQKWPDLTDFIQAKFMGSDRGALKESEKLGLLRKRLLAACSKRDVENGKKARDNMKFKSKKKEDLIQGFKECDFYKNLRNTRVKNARTQIDGMVSSLVNYIHNKHKSMDFNGIKLKFKTKRMKAIEDDPEIDNMIDLNEFKFYDRVTRDEEVAQPILLLHITDLITKYWENGSYSKFCAVIDCPFFASIDSCAGHVYTLETFKSMRKHAIQYGKPLVNPMTNKKIFGGLIFSTSTDTDPWNDYVLAHTFFRGKKICRDFSIWYFVIWKYVQKMEWIEEAILNKLHDYAFRRLENCEVQLAFSSLPLDPQERVKVPVACFYCTEGSSILFGQDKKLFANERLRMFSGVADQMLEILNHFGYDDVDKDFVRKRANTMSVVKELRRIPKMSEKRYCLAQKVFKATKDGRFLTYEVKNKDAITYFHLLKFSHKEMIPFDFGSKPLDLSLDIFEAYKYEPLYEVKLCKDTFRPYFVLVESISGEKVSNYRQILDCVTAVKVESNGELVFDSSVEKLNQFRLVSYSKHYINLTNNLNRFPTLDEFKNHVAKVRKFKEQKLVFLFPPDIVKRCKEHFQIYKTVNVTVKTFLKKAMATVSVEERVKMERRLNYAERKNFIEDSKKLIGNK